MLFHSSSVCTVTAVYSDSYSLAVQSVETTQFHSNAKCRNHVVSLQCRVSEPRSFIAVQIVATTQFHSSAECRNHVFSQQCRVSQPRSVIAMQSVATIYCTQQCQLHYHVVSKQSKIVQTVHIKFHSFETMQASETCPIYFTKDCQKLE